MSKRRYRSIPVNSLDVERLCEQIHGERIIVGIDIAKVDQFAALMRSDLSVLRTVRWKQPGEQAAFVALVQRLGHSASHLDVVMEPSGVYGDTIRHALLTRGIPVYRVSPKRAHDAAEVYDGVPSRHDAKAAAIIAKLHLDGASELWSQGSDHERQLQAQLRILSLYNMEYRRNRDRLESLTARHWPELTALLELGGATMLELLIAYKDPRYVVADPQGAAALMKRVGGHFLTDGKADQVVQSARSTVGVPMLECEAELVRVVATEARRHQQLKRQVERKIAELVGEDEVTEQMQAMVGKTTAAVLVASVGSPARYTSAAAYQKSFGLNLRENSSGTKKSGLHLTKRGPGIARRYLYMMALRYVQRDAIVRAWYERKVRRQGGQAKTKAVVAVMRKLTAALWHVAQGTPFDAALLFDTRRLELEA